MDNCCLSNFDLSRGVGLPYSSCTYNSALWNFIGKNGLYGTWLYFFADVDECSLKTHDCDANAICSNTVGSFTCKCNGSALYYGDGKTCSHHRKWAVTYFLMKLINASMLILWVIYNGLPLHFLALATLLSILTNEVVNIQQR